MLESRLMTGSKFADWLEKKYLEWQMERGRASIRKFSAWLGINHALVVQWMNAKTRPGEKSALLLADKLGFEVYDALEIPGPNPDEIELIRAYRAIPPDDQQALLDLIDMWLTQHGFRRVE